MACLSCGSRSGQRLGGSPTDSPRRKVVLLTTFRKQRNNERTEIVRARKVADDCARRNP